MPARSASKRFDAAPPPPDTHNPTTTQNITTPTPNTQPPTKPCGHTIHQECYHNLLSHDSIACPLCLKCAVSEAHRERLWAALDDAVAGALPDATRERALELTGGSLYRAWSVPSLFGRDVFEFVVKYGDSGGGGGRGGGDDDDAGGGGGGSEGGDQQQGAPPRDVLLTYCSQAGSVRYVWPISTPVSDLGAQRARLKQVREAGGFALVGCDLLECYDE